MPADRKLMKDVEVCALLHAGLRHTTIMGASAFLSDTEAGKHDWSDRLAEISTPTVMLHGDTDPAVNPKLARLAAARIAGCRYEEIAEAGQQLLHTIPDKVVAAIDEVRQRAG